MRTPVHPWGGLRWLARLVGALLTSVPAWAGGSPENAVLIIDPTAPDSLYVGNYYKNARNIPSSNVIYMPAGAPDYATFAANNLDGLFGSLSNAGINDHADYIVITPGEPFYVSAPGLISDQCFPVSRFSISSVYTMAFIVGDIQAGLASTTPNQYYTGTTSARAFDSTVGWLGGAPNSSPAARRYFIGAMLGYSGALGNTPAETMALIDRSVAADGTRPAGTFYFMNNTSDPNRNVRSPQYAGAVSAIQALGGQAQILPGVLPTGQHDCLGIMTGAVDLPFSTADITILPGAFGDHLTSWAATFDNSSQTKVSAWVRAGVSGSWGAVEEPCNYPGKFPAARVHAFYFQGASLGEAALRGAAYVPFQELLYGDPLTRPFAYLPSVAVSDAPTVPVSGTLVLTPTASTANPNAAIAQFDLLIDGVLAGSVAPGAQLTVDTTRLADGWHDLRVLAYDDTLVRSAGRWLGALTVNNHGHAVAFNVAPGSGNYATTFVGNVTASGGTVREVRVLQNGRVVAALPGPTAALNVSGLMLGAGPVSLQGEAVFSDGRVVRGAPAGVAVSPAAGTPTGQPPTAYGYRKHVRRDSPFVIELPATFDNSAVALTYEVLSAPTKATVATGSTGPYRLMRPIAGADGLDTFTFRVTSASGNSNVATVTIDYRGLLGDLNCDGLVNFADINPFVAALTGQAAYQAQFPNCDYFNADCNDDGVVSFADINPFVALMAGP